MKVLTDLSAGAWLADRMGAWATVGGVAGTGWEAYARLLHPVEAVRLELDQMGGLGLETPTILDEGLWSWVQIGERVGVATTATISWEELSGRVPEDRFEDGWSVHEPACGELHPQTLAVLVGHLAAHTERPDDLTLGVWDGWGTLHGGSGASVLILGAVPATVAEAHRRRVIAELDAAVAPEIRAALDAGALLHLPGRSYLVCATAASELADPRWVDGAGLGWREGRSGVLPQLLWPGDHAWLLASEIDLMSTYVGGSRALVDALLGDDRLEAFEVGADDALVS